MRTKSGVEVDHIPELDMEAEEPIVLQMEREVYTDKTTGQEDIPFSSLEWIENVRSEKGLVLDKMIHSLKTRGYMTKYPIVVHKVSAKKYRVLCGNRRTKALAVIKDTDPDLFKVILPSGKIPAIILEGLTEEEEGILLVDHSDAEDRVGLDEEGLYHAVVRLMRSNVNTQADIAAKLNLYKEKDGKMQPNRSVIQPRVNLARLPDFVQEEYLKIMRDGNKASSVRWADVATLYKHWKEGRDEGNADGGEKFKEYWKTISDPERNKKDKEGPSMISKKVLEEKAKSFNSRNGLRFANLVQGKPQKDDDGSEITDLQIIDNHILELEKAADLLAEIEEFMGPKKFADMISKIDKQRIEKAQKEEEERLAAERAEKEPAH